MFKQTFNPEKLRQALGVDVQEVLPWEFVVRPPFGAAWVVIPAGDETKVHVRQEAQVFFVVSPIDEGADSYDREV